MPSRKRIAGKTFSNGQVTIDITVRYSGTEYYINVNSEMYYDACFYCTDKDDALEEMESLFEKYKLLYFHS